MPLRCPFSRSFPRCVRVHDADANHEFLSLIALNGLKGPELQSTQMNVLSSLLVLIRQLMRFCYLRTVFSESRACCLLALHVCDNQVTLLLPPSSLPSLTGDIFSNTPPHLQAANTKRCRHVGVTLATPSLPQHTLKMVTARGPKQPP
jgi:hypothetical protein